MKKYIVSILIAPVFLIGVPFLAPKAIANDLNIRDFINLLIAIGAITPDKMPAVNAFLATLNNSVQNNVPPTPTSLATSTLPISVVGTSSTINGIDIMKEGAPGDFFGSQGITYNLNTSNILNNFYSNHTDDYDFIAIFSLKSLPADFSQVINQSGETLNGPAPINSPSRNLKSLVSVDISGVDSSALSGVSVADFEKQNMWIYLNVLAHEIGHHWLAYIPWEGMKSSHYTNMVDLFNGSSSYSDPMEYDHWINTVSGNVCVDHNSSAVTQRFSNLSLYLMGLISKTSVRPISVIQTATSYPYGQPQCNEDTNFLSTKTYTIDDIIALAGKDRIPAYPNTQKTFKVGYIVLVPADDNYTSDSINFASDIVNQFPQYWSYITNNLSHITPDNMPTSYYSAPPSMAGGLCPTGQVWHVSSCVPTQPTSYYTTPPGRGGGLCSDGQTWNGSACN